MKVIKITKHQNWLSIAFGDTDIMKWLTKQCFQFHVDEDSLNHVDKGMAVVRRDTCM